MPSALACSRPLPRVYLRNWLGEDADLEAFLIMASQIVMFDTRNAFPTPFTPGAGRT